MLLLPITGKGNTASLQARDLLLGPISKDVLPCYPSPSPKASYSSEVKGGTAVIYYDHKYVLVSIFQTLIAMYLFCNASKKPSSLWAYRPENSPAHLHHLCAGTGPTKAKQSHAT